MGQYILRRVIIAAPTIIASTIVVFLVLRVLPGDVALFIALGTDASGVANEAAIEAIREELGLNRPLPVQYVVWIGNALRGEFGESAFTHRTVAYEITSRLPLTVQLALMGQLLAFAIGIPLGIVSAMRRDKAVDTISRFWSILFLAMPQFWVALMLLLFTSRVFSWSPPLGYFLLWEDPGNNMLQLGPAALVLGVGGAAIAARMTRSSMLEVLGEDYIRTARAKGLMPGAVIIRHALRNALIPVISLSAVTFAFLLAGTVILETVYSIPGLGTLMLTSIRTRDYEVIQALVLISVIVVILLNLVVDIVYAWLDPRISYS